MILRHLHMVNFRNYPSLKFSPGPGINLIIGANGQGKTNLLEAIYASLMGTSFRTSSLKEALAFGQDSAFLQADISLHGLDHRLELEFSQGGRTYTRDQNTRKSLADYRQGLSMVVFRPDDLDMIRLSPSKRRSFLDTAIQGISPTYDENLRTYKSIIRQRNQALKSLASDKRLLEVYQVQLAQVGSRILYDRLRVVKKLAAWARKTYKSISGGSEELEIRYLSSLPFNQDLKTQAEIYIKTLKERVDEDLARGRTTVGPHVDDLSFLLDGKEARVYGSQGQQRSIVISLKLAELRLIKEALGILPPVILDDVFSELDRDRRTRLFSEIGQAQTFISLTDADLALKEDKLGEDIASFRIKEGRLTSVYQDK